MDEKKYYLPVKTTKGIDRTVVFHCSEKEITLIAGVDLEESDEIETLYIPSWGGIKRIGSRVFFDSSLGPNSLQMHSIKQIIIGEGIDDIGNNSFRLTHVQNVEFLSENIVINVMAFSGTSLKTVKIKNAVSIESGAFSNCAKLESVEITDRCDYIGYKAFTNCKKLSSVKLPDNINLIYDAVFENCKSLKEFNWPESCDVINYKTFSSCSSLKKINIKNRSIKILDRFEDTALSDIDLTNVFYLTLSKTYKRRSNKIKFNTSVYCTTIYLEKE